MLKGIKNLPYFIICSLFLILTSVSSTAIGQEINPPPWHFADIWWHLPGQKKPDFKSFSIDAEISRDLPENSNFYIAPIGLGALGNNIYYGGIQVGEKPICPNSTENRRGIFSRWNERDLTWTRIQQNGCSASSDNEGNYISVRRPMKWGKGKYTFTLTLAEIDGSNRRWVSLDVMDYTNNISTRIGSLLFPSGYNDFNLDIASFVEIFGRPINTSQIPEISIIFSNIKLNGNLIEPVSASVCFPKNVPTFAEVTSSSLGIIKFSLNGPHNRSNLQKTPSGGWRQDFPWLSAPTNSCR